MSTLIFTPGMIASGTSLLDTVTQAATSPLGFNFQTAAQTAPATTNQSAGTTDPNKTVSADTGYTVISFPKDQSPYYMDLMFADYQRPAIDQPINVNYTGGVRLPIPFNISDNQSVVYNAQALGPVAGQVINGIQATSDDISKSLGAFSGAIKDSQGGSVGGVVGTIGASLISGAGATGQAAASVFGATVNPWLQVLFQSPSFKSHEFRWRLAPRNQQESDILKNLILALKTAQLPQLMPSVQNAFLKYPQIVQPKLSNPEYTMGFKWCVIEDMIVNYAPNQTPGWFLETQAPVEVELAIRLMEIELWMKSTNGEIIAGTNSSPSSPASTSNPTPAVTSNNVTGAYTSGATV